ncbi:5-oxoprolinase subunit C family protein [Marinigracilibium pacificum]|uniref:Biotin-dependent carboxyltransferase family protein n=1 Tax=Marinigracilibium pacificum TaxID=2729599 RepID=A0A848IU00_9BACT|nr:biotin-dependent carboxyltransferase family protein [Marinigracilibium pacificum]NMM47216.1 biotin-dependent carboxyltransferase family protein [Marinigracilibium pacificum]
MSDCCLKFSKGGMYSTIQDGGREGFRKFGVPIGGFLDRRSAHLANKILGKEIDSPLIEITLIGPEFVVVVGEINIVLTGPETEFLINGEPAEMAKINSLKAGDIVKIGKVKYGCRAYLAFGGKLDIPKWLGSSSAAPLIAPIVTPWAIIKQDTLLRICHTDRLKINESNIKQNLVYKFPIEIHVTPGPEFHLFKKKQVHDFFKMEHEVSNESNRMGLRLKAHFNPGEIKNMISSGVVPGTIQITETGIPILLLADAQTTGGYLRFANVVDNDLDLCAQLKPGDQFIIKLEPGEETI